MTMPLSGFLAKCCETLTLCVNKKQVAFWPHYNTVFSYQTIQYPFNNGFSAVSTLKKFQLISELLFSNQVDG